MALTLAALASLTFSRPSQPEPDVEQRIQELTLKVRDKRAYRARQVRRWFGVD